MIIPIKCFTCGKVLADKYLYYIKEVAKRKKEANIDDDIIYLAKDFVVKTPEGEVLDFLKSEEDILKAIKIDRLNYLSNKMIVELYIDFKRKILKNSIFKIITRRESLGSTSGI